MLEFGWLNVDCNDNEIRILLIITNYDLHICMLHEHSPDHPIVHCLLATLPISILCARNMQSRSTCWHVLGKFLS
jgi:hypothetical protein